MIKMTKTLATLIMLVSAWNTLQAEEELLEPDKAFPFQVIVKDDTLHAEWNTAKGYYLYRNKIRLSTDTPGISLGEPQLPAGKIKQDEFFGEMEIYEHPVTARIPIQRDDPNVTEFDLTAVYQGCADIGVCYPPIKKHIRLDLPAKSGGAVAALGALGESLGFGGGGGEDEILEPDQAFQFSMDVADPNTLIANWQIAPDHYMYRGKISFDLAEGQTVKLGQVDLPAVLSPDTAALAHGLAVAEKGAADLLAIALAIDARVGVEDGALPPDHFRAAVARDFLGGGIEGEDRSLGIDDHEAVAHGVEDTCEKGGVVQQIVNIHVN